MIKKMVTIITPVYNAEDFIEETINSVLNQSYKNFELLLIDDCSKDESRNIIEQIIKRDNRVKYFCLEKNSGAAIARNKGIKIAQGEYIAFLDSDDIWKQKKLEKQLKFMNNNDYTFSYSSYEIIKQDGTAIGKAVIIPNRLNYSGLLKNTAIACSTVIINRGQIGDFQMPLVRKGQDTATWLMLLRERIDYAYGLDEVLSSYRDVKGSISDNKIKALKRTWNTYRNIEKLPFLKAVYYFSYYVFNAIKKRT